MQKTQQHPLSERSQSSKFQAIIKNDERPLEGLAPTVTQIQAPSASDMSRPQNLSKSVGPQRQSSKGQQSRLPRIGRGSEADNAGAIIASGLSYKTDSIRQNRPSVGRRASNSHPIAAYS